MPSALPEDEGEVCPVKVSSTRRFCVRPSAVAFEAIGSAAPRPCAAIISGFTPCVIRYRGGEE